VARQAAGNRNTTLGRKRSEGIQKEKSWKNQEKKNANILFVAIDKNHADSSVGVRPHL